MALLVYISHPEVIVDPRVPVTRWELSGAGVRRMRAFAASGTVDAVRALWCSDEAKAVEAARILGSHLGLEPRIDAKLGENDRSATGFLPPEAFQRTADSFFARPGDSVRGWERAVDAQERVRAALTRIVAGHGEGDLAVVGHGAVGTLMLCALRGVPISRAEDQPHEGHYWTADLPDLRLRHGWRPIAPRESGPVAS